MKIAPNQQIHDLGRAAIWARMRNPPTVEAVSDMEMALGAFYPAKYALWGAFDFASNPQPAVTSFIAEVVLGQDILEGLV